MPITVTELFSRSNVSYLERVRWGIYPVADTAGIYAVSLSSDPGKNDNLHAEAPISVAAVQRWMRRVPAFTFDDRLAPDANAVADFLARMWLPDESILYIGATGASTPGCENSSPTSWVTNAPMPEATGSEHWTTWPNCTCISVRAPRRK